MPWKCPACSSQIVHALSPDLPRPGVVYRCSVCRLELTFDAKIQKLRPAPLPPDNPDRNRKTA
jgi:DNA-directed RNA polymerase subunit RPC12/RpoP